MTRFLCLYLSIAVASLWGLGIIIGLMSFGINEATHRSDDTVKCWESSWYVYAEKVTKNNITVRVRDEKYKGETRVLPYHKYVSAGTIFEVWGGCRARCFFDKYGHDSFLRKASWGVQTGSREKSCSLSILLLKVSILVACFIFFLFFVLIFMCSYPHIKETLSKYRAVRNFNEDIEMEEINKNEK